MPKAAAAELIEPQQVTAKVRLGANQPRSPLSDREKKAFAVLGALAAGLYIYESTRKPTTTTTTPQGVVPSSTTVTGTGTVGITPGVPTSLTQTQATVSSITLNWTAVQNAVNYLVYDYTTNLLVGQSASNSITLNNLQASTHYTLYVEAQSATGATSGASAPITVSTSSTTQVATVPSVPQALNVTATTATSASFSWSPVSGATYYQITTLPAGQTTGGQVLSPISGTTATVSGLSPNVQYQFTLQACNTAGCSNPSGLTYATTPSAQSLVQSVTVTPATASVPAGQTVQFRATAIYAGNTQADVTSTATWSSGSVATATISSTGLVTGVAVGSTTIAACVGSVCGYGVIGVEPSTTSTQGLTSPTTGAALARIAVSPSTLSLSVGMQQQMAAIATYADGHTQDVTAQVSWSTNNSGVASITTSGLASGISSGIATISACIGGICGNSAITVPMSQSEQQSATLAAQAQSQATALQQAQARAAQYAQTAQAQQIAYNQTTAHNTYAQQANYGTPVSTQSTPLVNSTQPSGAAVQTQSSYYNSSTGTYSYLTSNNAGGYVNGQYVPVTVGVTGVKAGQSTTLTQGQCQPGTLSASAAGVPANSAGGMVTGSWDSYGNFHPGCSDCTCPVPTT